MAQNYRRELAALESRASSDFRCGKAFLCDTKFLINCVRGGPKGKESETVGVFGVADPAGEGSRIHLIAKARVEEDLDTDSRRVPEVPQLVGRRYRVRRPEIRGDAPPAGLLFRPQKLP